MKIAVVGTGIAGLGAAWALQRRHDVTVYEAADRLGGHSNTVDVPTAEGTVPVDTGFIVYNERTYPHLTRLFGELDVATQESDMSFSFSLDGELEYAGSLGGLVAAPRNLLRRRYRQMIADILRFRRVGGDMLQEAGGDTLDEVLRRHDFSLGFVDDYLVPMAAAIWSARRDEIRRHPARPFLRFFANHGLIRISDRPQWRTVSGGSREYVARVAATFRDPVRLDAPVEAVVRTGAGVTVEANGSVDTYDHVVLATHSDQALAVLRDGASDDERAVLKAIGYDDNVAVLHSDPALMPRRRSVWSSWNYVTRADAGGERRASVTYWMNRLQDLPTTQDVFVSLNPVAEPDPSLVHRTFHYAHPQFDTAALDAQRSLPTIQGVDRVWFAGAWCGYGFHEDGLQSGLNVAAALGAPAPWHDVVTPMSSAPPAATLVAA